MHMDVADAKVQARGGRPNRQGRTATEVYRMAPAEAVLTAVPAAVDPAIPPAEGGHDNGAYDERDAAMANVAYHAEQEPADCEWTGQTDAAAAASKAQTDYIGRTAGTSPTVTKVAKAVTEPKAAPGRVREDSVPGVDRLEENPDEQTAAAGGHPPPVADVAPADLAPAPVGWFDEDAFGNQMEQAMTEERGGANGTCKEHSACTGQANLIALWAPRRILHLPAVSRCLPEAVRGHG